MQNGEESQNTKKVNKALKFRLWPTPDQIIFFHKSFGCTRKIWNLMLSDKIDYYRAYKKTLQTTPAQYKEEYAYLKEVDSLALANVQINLEQAYKNFFKNKKFGFPKFKSKKSAKKSYTTNNHNGSIKLLDNGIRLPKIGFIKAKIHRLPDSCWKLKSATVSEDSAGAFYVSVLFEYERQVTAVKPETVLGLDYKSDGLYMDSEGNTADNPKAFRASQKKLAKEQRKLSKKDKGSNNYEKQRKKVAKVYRKAANQRKDFLNKKSTEIANQYDIICIEDLNLKGIANKKNHLGKATMDNGWGMFVKMLAYKQDDRGHVLEQVDRFYPSSQTCHWCGHKQKMSLDKRVYICPECGMVMDRDLNAAINIEAEGLRMYRQTSS